MSKPNTLISKVERVHLVVAAVAALAAAVLADAPVWAGVIAGVALGAGNFRLLALVTSRLIQGETRTRNAAVGWLVLKLAAMGVAVGLVFRWLDPDPIALLAGLTLAPLCLVAVVLAGRHQVGDGAAPSSSAPAAASGIEAP